MGNRQNNVYAGLRRIEPIWSSTLVSPSYHPVGDGNNGADKLWLQRGIGHNQRAGIDMFQ